MQETVSVKCEHCGNVEQVNMKVLTENNMKVSELECLNCGKKFKQDRVILFG